MSFIVKENQYILEIFFISLPPELTNFKQGGDITGMVWRDNETNVWHLDYRFRYYKSPKVFDGDDHKVWYNGTMNATSEEEVLKGLDTLLPTIAEGAKMFSGNSNVKLDRIKIQGDNKKFLEITTSGQIPWMHFQRVIKE